MVAKRVRGPILVVEDSPEDYDALVRTLRDCGVTNDILRFEDGADALEYLHAHAPFKHAEIRRPAFMILDLNLPGTGGHEVLREVKNDPYLRTIPVIVMSASNSAADVRECYQNGANSYVQKHVGMTQYRAAVEHLKTYWLETVTLPSG